MKTIYKWLVCIAVCSLLIAGCTTKVTEKDQFSGFLPSYDGLQQVTSPSGHAVLLWMAPDWRNGFQ
ncbi:hypothetical protein PS903_04799 [Pseudomonas fluorescens]|nr:hypothetical protein PS903_04799 [Pseudomonas fluorescens]